MDISEQINFNEYGTIFNQHDNTIKEWNINSDKLETIRQKLMSPQQDEQKGVMQDDVIQNELYAKYAAATKIMDEQTKRLHRIGSDDHILQLISTQHKISVECYMSILIYSYLNFVYYT